MNWSQGRVSYYTDFAVVPLFILFATLHIQNWTLNVLAAICGVVVWTLLEYVIHRFLFHRLMKRQHWLHHKDPAGYVAAPLWLTLALHTLLLGLLGSYAPGVFIGLEAGYFAYIITHDRIHHGLRRSSWIQWRARLHDAHHAGWESNFGVIISTWDFIFRTHRSDT